MPVWFWCSSTLKNSFKITPELIAHLQSTLGSENVLTTPEDTWAYGSDNSRMHAQPDLVVLPTTHEQVCDVVKACYQNDIPIISRGRGTGTTGATVPTQGGVILSFERMNKLIEIDVENRVATVEPGVTNQALQDAAKEHGFFWPPDPTSAAFCTIGGNLAYNSAGPRAVKYGTPRDNTLGLKVVLASGETLTTGVYTTKGVVGYDLTRLLIGSEGTLGFITQAYLKLTPLPPAKRTMQAVYASMRDAASAVSAIMAQPVTPCALEFIDGKAIEMIRAYSGADLPRGAGAMLMIETDGEADQLPHNAEAIKTAATNNGLVSFTIAESQAQVDELWATRKALSPALRKVAPKKINEDVVVPVSKIPDLIGTLEKLADQYQITIVNFGHAGNGNIHVNLLVNPDDPEEMQRAHECLNEVFDHVIALQGSLSGEHGVGLEKQPYVGKELDTVAIGLMKNIKKQFDPKGLINPGKMWPEA